MNVSKIEIYIPPFNFYPASGRVLFYIKKIIKFITTRWFPNPELFTPSWLQYRISQKLAENCYAFIVRAPRIYRFIKYDHYFHHRIISSFENGPDEVCD